MKSHDWILRGEVTPRPAAIFVLLQWIMFVWIELYFGNVMPDKTDEDDGSVLRPERQFWFRLGDAVSSPPPANFFPAKDRRQCVSFEQREPPG